MHLLYRKRKKIANHSVYNLHYEKFTNGSVKCIEDEIPFDLPEGWAWAFLSNIVYVLNGDRGQSYPAKSKLRSKGIPFVSASNIQDGVVSSDGLLCLSDSQYDALGAGKLFAGDIVYCIRGSLGKCGLFTMEKGAIASSLVIVRSLFDAPHIIDYIFLYLNSALAAGEIKKYDNGSAQPNLAAKDFRHFLVPLPPQAEMQRINKQAREALVFVKRIQNNKDELHAAIAVAKSKILDLAIHGQLVPQDPADEPASVLLDRIRTEREELIRQGKIKRDKKESVIFRGEDNSYYEKVGSDVIYIDAEIPFEIPDTWEWMRLESCCIKEIRRGKSPKYIDESGTLVFAQKCNTKYSGIDVGLALFLDESILGRYPNDEYMQDGDVVINSTGTGTLGRVGIYHMTDNHRGLPIVPDSHVTVIRAAHSIQSIYVYACMKANQSELEKEGEGSTNQKELKPLTLKEMLIPIPPCSEQERIVATITAAFSTISAVEKSLN